MATHWKIPWTEEPTWATTHAVKKSWTELSMHAGMQAGS